MGQEPVRPASREKIMQRDSQKLGTGGGVQR